MAQYANCYRNSVSRCVDCDKEICDEHSVHCDDLTDPIVP